MTGLRIALVRWLRVWNFRIADFHDVVADINSTAWIRKIATRWESSECAALFGELNRWVSTMNSKSVSVLVLCK